MILVLLTSTRTGFGLPGLDDALHVIKAGCHSGFVFQCEVWSQADAACHCNSHRKSVYWKILRDGVLLGGLQNFNLEVSDLDLHLKQAGSCIRRLPNLQLLPSIRLNASRSSREGASGLQGGAVHQAALLPEGEKFDGVLLERAQGAGPCLRVSVDGSSSSSKLTKTNLCEDLDSLCRSYSPVYEHVSSFLDEADEQEDKAAAIMRLGAAQEFLRHFQGSRYREALEH